MRTTLTLDDDVARLIEDAMHRERRPMKQIINEALRSALRPSDARREPYVLIPHEGGRLQPGIDPAGMNRLAGDLEDEALMSQWSRDS